MLGFSACKHSPNPITINSIDSLSFRRSYDGFENWPEDRKDFLENRDPNGTIGSKLKTKIKLSKNGLIHNDSLKLSYFKNLDSFVLKSNKGDSIKVFSNYMEGFSKYEIFVTDGSDTSKIQLSVDNPEIKFALIDFIPGNFPEIIILRNYYIMNGDNYDINIYQVYK